MQKGDNMANKNYQAGRRKEWQVQEMLEKVGYKTTRSSGSHGLWDVCAVNENEVRLIQVKYTEGNGIGISEVDLEPFELFKVPMNTSKELWTFKKGNNIPNIKEIGG